jgi:uncharacterized C2H2 Zn-finger protein
MLGFQIISAVYIHVYFIFCRCSRAGCDVTFKTMALFSNHMCRAHDLVPYTLVECVQCERRFRTEKSHEWHVRHMHGEERLCDKCDFVASSKAMLKSVIYDILLADVLCGTIAHFLGIIM